MAVQEADDPKLKQMMQVSLIHSNSLVKDKQSKMHDFIRQTSQDRDYFREQNHVRIGYRKNSQNSDILANSELLEDTALITTKDRYTRSFLHYCN